MICSRSCPPGSCQPIRKYFVLWLPRSRQPAGKGLIFSSSASFSSSAVLPCLAVSVHIRLVLLLSAYKRKSWRRCFACVWCFVLPCSRSCLILRFLVCIQAFFKPPFRPWLRRFRCRLCLLPTYKAAPFPVLLFRQVP